MKKGIQKVVALLLCLTMLCVIGCTPNDDTTVTTTTTQEMVTTTTEAGDDVTTTVGDVTDDTTTVGDVTDDTTTAGDVATTKTDKVTTTTKNDKTDGGNKVTTTTTKKTTTTAAPTTTKAPIATTTKYNGPTRVITCYGDSVTEGMSVAQEEKYPTILQGLLGDGYKVQNAGDGGEKTQSIMARQGALKVYLKNDVTFAAGATQVQIDEGKGRGVLTENGKEVQWTPPYGRDLPMNKVTINGGTYEFKFTDHNYEQNGTCKTFLTRADGSKAVTLAKGTEVVINTATTSKTNYCDIYLMGFNGDYTDVNDLIAQHKKMIEYRANDRYLIIIPFFNGDDASTAAFKAEFGDHALDFRAYTLVAANLEKAGLKLSNADKMNIRQKVMPFSLKLYGSNGSKDVHLSAAGYKVLAQALYEQGQKVNLW